MSEPVPHVGRDLRALGVDLGDARIGVAICDSAGVLATPLETVHRSGDRGRDHQKLVQLAEEAGVSHVVLGVPYSLDGSSGPAAQAILDEIKLVEAALPEGVVVHCQDERFTTVTATQAMTKLGIKPKRRKQIVDQIAAAVILQSWLDAQPVAADDRGFRTKNSDVPPPGGGSS